MSELHQQIADLEAEIETLSDTAEGVRKTILVAKVAMGGGALSVLTFMIGPFHVEPLVLVAGIAAVFGGIALYGSNRSTLDDIRASIRSHEARRAAMIDELELPAIKA
ncbi:hypothetical protein [Microvirga alba]|uniref:Uncharacterized protein n=1 Tax=Microvirga alba TaxID=2791025 RepID=A0A931FP15_9HYPH|nr:hypothetical protein [Microvirga alba]MBF9234260.1 hypothetical protein [Microvirga alba]